MGFVCVSFSVLSLFSFFFCAHPFFLLGASTPFGAFPTSQVGNNKEVFDCIGAILGGFNMELMLV